MLIRELMQTQAAVNSQASLSEVCSVLSGTNQGVIVTDVNGAPAGLVTRQVICEAIARGHAVSNPVESVMLREFKSVTPDDMPDVCSGAQELWPVVERGMLVGAVSLQTLTNWMQKQIEESKAYLDMVIHHSINGIVIVNVQGRVIAINEAAEKMTGSTRDRALGRLITEIIPHTGLPEVLRTGKPQDRQKLALGDVTVISNRRPILRGEEVIGAIGVFQDISRQELLSHDLQLSKEANKMLDSIIEACYEGLYITDGNGVGLRANKAYDRITGVQSRDIIGKHMSTVVAEGIVSDSVTLKVLKQKKPVTITQHIKSGVTVLVTGNPVFDDDGNIAYVITTVRNVSELHKLQQQLTESANLSKKYLEELKLLRERELATGNIITASHEMRKVKDVAARVAKVDSTCLLLGESGVGKDVIAKFIHSASPRSNNAFIKVNCGAIPGSLLEAELFGYEAGAFTGARKEGKPGMFELANEGTLFLDEIGEIPPDLQVKLLQALQDMLIYRVGGTKPVKIDTRIIAATNRNLEQMVQQGLFRKDLFYRLNIVPIEILPLRRRRDDILPLVELILGEVNRKYGKNKCLDSEVIRYFANYDWPGNVRELRNIVERMVVISTDDVIKLGDTPLPLPVKGQVHLSADKPGRLKEAVAEFEREFLSQSLKEYKSMRKAARMLGVNQSTIVRKVRKYSLPVETLD